MSLDLRLQWRPLGPGFPVIRWQRSSPTQVRVFVVVVLLFASQTLTAVATPAQTLHIPVDSVVTSSRPVGRDVQPAHRFDLTLDDAVQRALERNLDIAVQRIHPLVQDMRVATANAAFLPFASSGFSFN